MSNKADSFIGSEFITKRGGTLTITRTNGMLGKNKRYICHCSICSSDQELWPEGSMQTLKVNIKRGNIPCSCNGTSVFWSEEQYKVLINRECVLRDYTFHGWYGEYNKSDSYLELENKITGNRWTSTNLYNFFMGKGDPKGKRVDRKKTLEHYQGVLLSSNNFTDGTYFTEDTVKSEERGSVYLFVHCPKCLTDSFSVEGNCTSIFSSSYHHLREGKLPCRCSIGRRWSEEERLFQIKRFCSDKGYTFLKWKSEFKGNNTKLEWLCNKNHKNSTSVNNFINHKRGCSCCNKVRLRGQSATNGYFYNRWDEQDWLYLPRMVFNDKTKALKCGRSFNLTRRFKDILKASGATEINNLYLWTATHKDVYDTEQLIKDTLYNEGFNYYEDGKCSSSWEGSTEVYLDNPLVIDRIFSIIEDSPLTLIEDNTA